MSSDHMVLIFFTQKLETVIVLVLWPLPIPRTYETLYVQNASPPPQVGTIRANRQPRSATLVLATSDEYNAPTRRIQHSKHMM